MDEQSVWLMMVEDYRTASMDVREVYTTFELASQAFRRYCLGYARRGGKGMTCDFITEKHACIWWNDKVILTVILTRRLLRSKLSTRQNRTLI